MVPPGMKTKKETGTGFDHGEAGRMREISAAFARMVAELGRVTEPGRYPRGFRLFSSHGPPVASLGYAAENSDKLRINDRAKIMFFLF